MRSWLLSEADFTGLKTFLNAVIPHLMYLLETMNPTRQATSVGSERLILSVPKIGALCAAESLIAYRTSQAHMFGADLRVVTPDQTANLANPLRDRQ